MFTSTNPDSPKNFDLDWAQRELIPFLELVFGEIYGCENRPTDHWIRMVLFARHKLDRIVSTSVLRFYFGVAIYGVSHIAMGHWLVLIIKHFECARSTCVMQLRLLSTVH